MNSRLLPRLGQLILSFCVISALNPAAWAAQSPDAVYKVFTKRINGLGLQLSDASNYAATETLVNGIYAFWPKGNFMPHLTNETATIYSDDQGLTWKYLSPGLPQIPNPKEFRDALLSNVRLEEFSVQRYGNGKRKLLYFTAVDCPYCNAFEKKQKELLQGGNASVYIVPANLDSNDLNRSNIVRSYWCANSTWPEWENLAQNRKVDQSKMAANNVDCPSIRTVKQSWLLHKMLRGSANVPFFIADDGWSGVPSRKVSVSELNTIYNPPKNMNSPLKFGENSINLASWGTDVVPPMASAAKETLNLGPIKITLPKFGN